MDAYDSANWTGLFGAEVSASAALTGLIFVVVSINLKLIIGHPSLPRRVLSALFMLMLVLFTSTLALPPGQSAAAFGGNSWSWASVRRRVSWHSTCARAG